LVHKLSFLFYKYMSYRDLLLKKSRIVIKIGTSSLTYPSGRLNLRRIEKLVRVLSDLRNSGKKVVLVSSGAIAVGTGKLGLTSRPDSLPGKQAAAAIGQTVLMKIYQKFFDEYNQLTGQILLTRDVMEIPIRRINAENTFRTLLDMNVIPIVNENDSVSTEQIEFGDNDTLSAMVATLVDADLLVMLSDIDGLYNNDPRKDPDARIIPMVTEISSEIEGCASGAGSAFSTGGMRTKIIAARICDKAGIDTVVANGDEPSVLYDIFEGKDVGTLFVAHVNQTIKSE
jgi:glutamate 5-kinase